MIRLGVGRARMPRLSTMLAAASLVASTATGQTRSSALPREVTLTDVMKLLDERSPRTAAERATIGVAAADRVTARTWPNPSLNYGGVHLVSGLSTGAVTQHQVVAEQPLLLFHQRQARLAEADLNVHAEEARVAQLLADRRMAVRQAFASLLSRQEQLRVTEASLTNLERVAQVVRSRAAAGDRSQYEVLRIETETESTRVQAMNAATEVEDASRLLAILLGLPGWSPHAMGVLQAAEVPTGVEQLWVIAQQRRPSLVAIRQRQAAARGGLFLAQRERLPVPAVSGGTQLTRDVTGTSAFFGLSLPLPLFDRNQGAIARATAQIEVEDLSLGAEMGEARAEIERGAALLLKRREALAALERTVVQRIPVLRQMAEDAYREGSADILELLDANRSLRDFQLAHVQQLESVKLAEEIVIAASGIEPPPPVP